MLKFVFNKINKAKEQGASPVFFVGKNAKCAHCVMCGELRLRDWVRVVLSDDARATQG